MPVSSSDNGRVESGKEAEAAEETETETETETDAEQRGEDGQGPVAGVSWEEASERKGVAKGKEAAAAAEIAAGRQRFRQRTEVTRERDVYRHLHPWTATYRPAHLNRTPFAYEPSEAIPTPEPCSDTALAAFAQLCAHRLVARRCLVTLISTHVEYVLAEATRSMTLQNDFIEDARDKPWIGTCSFPRDDGINTLALQRWRKAKELRAEPTVAEGTGQHYYVDGISPHWMIVSDLRGDAKYRGYKLVQRAPWARFYASVPLRGSQGSVLGSVTVLDDKPRYGISALEMSFLEDIADTITEHLDATVTRSIRQRSEKLIQALGLFNNGRGSLREWWAKQEDSWVSNTGRYAKPQTQRMTEGQRQARVDEEFGTQESGQGRSRGSSGSGSGSSREPGGRRRSRQQLQGLDISSEATSGNFAASEDRRAMHTIGHDFFEGTRRDSDSAALNPDFVGQDINAHADEQKETAAGRVRHVRTAQSPAHVAEEKAFNLARSISKTYARATNLIREAVGAEGVVCVDANGIGSASGRGGSYSGSESDNMERTGSSGSGQAGQHLNASRGSGSSVSGDTTTTSGAQSGDSDTTDHTGPDARVCRVQSFSTRTKSSVTGSAPSAHSFALPEASLARLIQRYPEGHIFNFDREGGLCSSSGEDPSTSASSGGDSSVTRRISRRSKDAARLSKVLPGARTVAFFPVWDDTHSRFRSALIVWSTSELRYFDQAEDLTYLSSWSHSLIAELSRLETIAADRAKGTFISSVSHELRSPLHGVLAGVELLMESAGLTGFQREMAYTISTAGRTLLDTVNHILDYSKISNFTRAQRKARGERDDRRHRLLGTGAHSGIGGSGSGTATQAMAGGNPNEPGVSFDLDLAKLTEEIVESVVSAHRFQHLAMGVSSPGATDRGEHGRSEYGRRLPSYQAGGLAVYVDIAYRSNWTLKVQPGGWTRIVTNLVGNALKYTSEGHITIRLEFGEPNSQDLIDAGNSRTANSGTTRGRKRRDVSSVREPDGEERTGERCSIQLVVEDTGMGISKQFLSSDLYTPFKQEDSHSTGTGLGLSIVKQIARDMHAKLNITSELGKGTRAVLKFEGLFAGDSAEGETKTSVGSSDLDRFHLLTLEPASDSVSGIAMVVLKTASEWLRPANGESGVVETSHGPTLPSAAPGRNCYAITERDLQRCINERRSFLSQVASVSRSGSRLIVLADTMRSTRLGELPEELESNEKLSIAFAHHPIGPQKLMRLSALDDPAGSGQDGLETPVAKEVSPPERQSDMRPSPPRATVHSGLAVAVKQQRPQLRPKFLRRQTSQTSRTLSDTSSQDGLETPESDALSGWRIEGAHQEQREAIMLVEDNDVNMKLLVALMRKLQLPHTCAVNGREAVDAYRSAPARYLLILMDISMPILDGYAATAKIRETERKHRLPRTAIVALTGVTSAEARERAFDCGVDEYFAKPVRMTELKELVGRVKAKLENKDGK